MKILQQLETGYRGALIAAGAKVLVLKYFGSYQGDIWAKVKVGCKLGWITIGYGSCSYCDAYQSHFETGEDCNKTVVRLAEFGKPYLERLLTQIEAEAEAGKHADWDSEAEDMVTFIRSHAATRKAVSV